MTPKIIFHRICTAGNTLSRENVKEDYHKLGFSELYDLSSTEVEYREKLKMGHGDNESLI